MLTSHVVVNEIQLTRIRRRKSLKASQKHNEGWGRMAGRATPSHYDTVFDYMTSVFSWGKWRWDMDENSEQILNSF